MTEINILRPETFEFTDEAVAYADNLFERFDALLHQPLELTGENAQDEAAQYLRDLDLGEAAELAGTDFVYIGHTNYIYGYLYQALVDGYAPTPEQLEAREGHDFLWDEVMDLPEEHPDVHALLDKYGYDSREEVPVQPGFVGAYVMPKQKVKDIFMTLYLRGKDYKEFGWGFPWISDDLTPTLEAATENTGSLK